MINAFIVLAD